MYLYQKILKYPRPVRKVRKFSKTLTKTKNPRIDITKRKKAFSVEYQSELSKTSKLLKKKSVEQITKPEQIVKKPVGNSKN